MILESNTKKVYGAAFFFTIIVGCSFLGIKSCIPLADPLVILAYRFNFALLAALIPIMVGLVKVDIREKDKSALMWTAGFYIGFIVLQTIGLIFSTSVEAGIIFSIVPILAKIIAGIFLNEKTTIRQNIFMCVSVSAVIVMFIFGTTDIQVNFIGLIVLLLSSISMAISNVFMRGVRALYTPYEIALCIALFGFVIFNVLAIGWGLKTGSLEGYIAPLKEPVFLISIIYLGVLSTLVSTLLLSYMLANLQALKATVFGNLATALSIVVGIVVLKEPVQMYHIVCTALIIVGVIGVSLPTSGVIKPSEEKK